MLEGPLGNALEAEELLYEQVLLGTWAHLSCEQHKGGVFTRPAVHCTTLLGTLNATKHTT
jgi:hypothetical protein